MSKWTTTKLIIIAGLAGIYLLISLFGSIPQTILGMGANIFILIPLGNMIIIFAVLLIRKFGTASLLALIHAIGALPLATMGPPGFLPKIPAAFLGGLAVDIVFFSLKKRPKLASITAASIGEITLSFVILGFGLLFAVFTMPGWSEKVLSSPLLIAAGVIFIMVLAAIGGYLGWLLYRKLKNTAIVRRIQS